MQSKRNDSLMGRLAIAVAKGSSVRAGAKALDVSPRTSKRWAALPEFKQLVIRIREQINAQVVDRYRLRLLKNLDKLAKIIDDPMTESDVAVKAMRNCREDFVALDEHLNPGGQSARSGAPGLIVPNLDPRWAPGATETEGGGECSTPTD